MGHREGTRGRADPGCQVRRLLRLRRADVHAALPPRSRPVPGREGGGPRRLHRAGGAGHRRGGLRGPHRRAVRHRRRGQARRHVVARDRALGMAHEDPVAPGHRPADAAAAGRRGRGGARVRRQPARSAAGRARGHPRHDRARPRLSHGGEGGRGGRHGQGRGDRHHLPAQAAGPLGRGAGHAGAARPRARRGAGRHRQRHRLARDGQTGRRAGPAAPRPHADQGDGLRGGGVGVLGLVLRLP